MPKRSRSKREALVAIISIAQHARPKVRGHIERDRDQFTVTAQELTDDMDSGEAIVEQFKAELEAGTVDLASVYPARTNDQLREVPEIANRLRLKGYK